MNFLKIHMATFWSLSVSWLHNALSYYHIIIIIITMIIIIIKGSDGPSSSKAGSSSHFGGHIHLSDQRKPGILSLEISHMFQTPLYVDRSSTTGVSKLSQWRSDKKYFKLCASRGKMGVLFRNLYYKRLEISSRKWERLRKHFMQGWTIRDKREMVRT